MSMLCINYRLFPRKIEGISKATYHVRQSKVKLYGLLKRLKKVGVLEIKQTSDHNGEAILLLY